MGYEKSDVANSVLAWFIDVISLETSRLTEQPSMCELRQQAMRCFKLSAPLYTIGCAADVTNQEIHVMRVGQNLCRIRVGVTSWQHARMVLETENQQSAITTPGTPRVQRKGEMKSAAPVVDESAPAGKSADSGLSVSRRSPHALGVGRCSLGKQ